MDGSSNQALAAQYYWWKAKMGIDIEVYAEKEKMGNGYFLCQKKIFLRAAVDIVALLIQADVCQSGLRHYSSYMIKDMKIITK